MRKYGMLSMLNRSFFSTLAKPAINKVMSESMLATLKRTDYNGNTFIMRENIPLTEAERLAKYYQDLGHHQYYEVEVASENTLDPIQKSSPKR